MVEIFTYLDYSLPTTQGSAIIFKTFPRLLVSLLLCEAFVAIMNYVLFSLYLQTDY